MSPLVFLSHSGVDTEAARLLKRRLEEAPAARETGLRVWFDKDSLDAGRPWRPQIEKAMAECEAFIVYVGSGGVRNWVEAEVDLALNRATTEPEFRFVSVVPNEPSDVEALPPFVRRFQAVFSVEKETAQFDALMRALLLPADRGVLALEERPFFGLQHIDEERAHLFFGREKETADLIERVRANQLVLVSGDSGSGKSSLVRAGLVPAWRGGRMIENDPSTASSTIWHVVTMRPGSDPNGGLGDAIEVVAKGMGYPTGDQLAFARCAASGDASEVLRGMRCGLDPERTRTLLVVDQFEELFTSVSKEVRTAFIDRLLAIADGAGRRVSIVLTMRHDYANLCSEHVRLFERLNANDRLARFPLGRMSDAGLHDIVTKPLALAGIGMGDSEALAKTVKKEVGDRAGDLALVQMALKETWDARLAHHGDLLQAYAAVGRVEGALANAANRVAGGSRDGAATGVLTPAERALLDSVLVRLVRLGDTVGATRRTATRDEFDATRWMLLQKLASEEGRRLMITGGGDGQLTVEIAHEALVNAWPRYQELLQSHAGDKRTLDSLMAKAGAWAARESKSDRRKYLATGADLEQFVALSRRRCDWLSPMEATYVAQSASHHRHERIAWSLLQVLMVVALVGFAIGFYVIREHQRLLKQQAGRLNDANTVLEGKIREATENLEQAQRNESIRLAGLAEAEIARGDAATGMLLALRGMPTQFHPLDRPIDVRTKQELLDGLLQLRERLVLRGHEAPVSSAAYSPDGASIVTASWDDTARVWDAATGTERLVLRGHEGYVLYVAWSPDGVAIVTASFDSTARVWDAATGAERLVLRGHEGYVRSAAWSPDGASIVTASEDKTARVWDAVTGAEQLVLRGHENWVRSAAWSPDGDSIVTASEDKTARVWDAAARTERFVLRGHKDWVRSAAWSPDGASIVTASRDGTARVWNAATGAERLALRGHEQDLRSAAWSPDGASIVTASDDKAARVWDAATGTERLILRGHEGWVSSAAWSPDGASIATASHDKTARVWDTATGRERFVLRGHEGSVRSAVCSPDAATIVTASEDNTARVWDEATGTERLVLRGHEGYVRSAAWSPNGASMVTASDDCTARVWDAATGTERLALRGHEAPVNSAAWSPDGALIVTASDDGTARVWDAATGAERLVLNGHEDSVWLAAWSPDGASIVSASWDNTARVWDAATGTERLVLRGHEDVVISASWSPDAASIVTASYDQTARVWDAAGGAERLVLRGHEGYVSSAAWSSDGASIATASGDKTARMWDAETGTERLVLRGHEAAVHFATFSLDSKWVLTASDDGTARLWPIDPELLVTEARKLLPRELTPEQEAKYYLTPIAVTPDPSPPSTR